MANRTVSVALRAEVAGLVNGLTTAGRSVKQFSGELDGLGKKSPQKLNDIAMAAGGLGASLVGMAGYAVHAAMAFDQQMSAVSAATKASASDMHLLREAALQAGKDTIFSATGAAEAQTALAKAGVSVRDSLGGGLKGALDLAAAGTMDVGDAAEIAATAMTQFGLSGKDIPHVADLLAAGAGKAQGEVADMGMALQQSGLVANQFGISIEETTGTLAAFASAGLIGSDAGTSLKTMLLMLANPSKEAAQTMERLGIAAYDAQGRFVGVSKLAEQLKTKMSGLTQEQRDAALATIFGSDAIRAANVLYKQGGEGVDDWTKKVDDAGFASDQAARKTDNLAGDLERLKGSLETAAIEAGSGANGGLRLLVQALDGLVSGFSSLPGPLQTALTVLAGAGGAGLLATAGLIKVKETVGDALDALKEMGPSGERAAGGLEKVGKIAGQAAAWGAAAGIAYEGIKLFIDFLNKDVQGAERNVDEMAKSMLELAKSGKVVGELRNAFGGDLRKLTEGHTEFVKTQREMSTALHDTGNALDDLGRAIAANNAESAGLNDKQRKKNNDFIESIDAVDKALANVVSKGGTTQAKLAYDELAATWTAAGKPLAELNALLPDYNKAIGDAAAGNDGAAAGFGSVEQNARTMAGSLNAAVQAGQSLVQVFDQLNGGFINSTEAAIAAEANIDALTESVKQHGNSLDIDTAAGQANVGIIVKGAQLARDAAQAKYEETGSLEAAKATYDGYIGKLRTTAGDLKFNKEKTDELFTSISNMPPLKATQISLPGIDAATEKVVGLQTKLSGLQDRTITVTTVQNTVTGATRTVSRAGPRFERWGGITEHAQTGLLREAGVFSPAGPARYAFAEPATGGEAFVPRNGDYGRSMSILSQAASWYGARVMPGGAGGGVTNVTIPVVAGMGVDGPALARQIAGVLRPYISSKGGNVQVALGES